MLTRGAVVPVAFLLRQRGHCLHQFSMSRAIPGHQKRSQTNAGSGLEPGRPMSLWNPFKARCTTVTPAVSELRHLPLSLCKGLHVECENCQSSCTSQSWMVYMESPVVWVFCCSVLETSKVEGLRLHSVLFSNLLR